MRAFASKRDVMAVALLATLAVPIDKIRAEGAFTRLAGSWIGSGTLVMPGGSRERIRCRATYVIAWRGDALNQALRCASDSYRVAINSSAIERGGHVSGSWAELTQGVTGTLTGYVRGPVIAGTVNGMGLSAALSLVTRGRTQSVSIWLARDTAGVVITFRRQ